LTFFKNRPSLTVRTDSVSNEPFSRESVERALKGEGVAAIEYIADFDDAEETCFIGFAGSWEQAREVVRQHFETNFMYGDCWHLAIALNAVLDFRLGGVGRIDGDQWIVDHVFAYLEDGRYLDIRGVHETKDDLLSYRPKAVRSEYTDRAVTVDDIVNLLDGWARDEGYEPFAWTDPQKYEFASLSRQLVTALELERFVPVPALCI
jgi:hypothetical protein